MIKWGVVGLGTAAVNFAKSFSEINNGKLSAVGSFNKNKIELFKANCSLEKCFDNYDDLINSTDVDAVYVATVNHLHYDLVKKCARAKKNVLCEKPIGLNFSQVEELSILVNNFNIKCAEAVAYYVHPQINTIKKILDSKILGEIIAIESYFGFKAVFDPQSRIYNPKLGGGALLDLGCYPMSFLMLFAKNEKNSIKFLKKNITFSETIVDDYAEAELMINNQIRAKIAVSIKENMKNTCKIMGTKGFIEIMNPWLPGKKESIKLKMNSSTSEEFIHNKYDFSIYANQINVLSNYFDNDDIPKNIFNISKSIVCSQLIHEWKNA